MVIELFGFGGLFEFFGVLWMLWIWVVLFVMLGLLVIGVLVGGLWVWIVLLIYVVVVIICVGEWVYEYLGSEF